MRSTVGSVSDCFHRHIIRPTTAQLTFASVTLWLGRNDVVVPVVATPYVAWSSRSDGGATMPDDRDQIAVLLRFRFRRRPTEAQCDSLIGYVIEHVYRHRRFTLGELADNIGQYF